MRLNQASDFALRVVMLLAAEDEPMTVEEIAGRLNLVKSHVMKLVAKLVKADILHSTRGRSGGVSLARDSAQITVGTVVRAIESDFAVVECMQSKPSTCVFAPDCKLRGVMVDARSAFMDVLDRQTVQSIVS